jgi:hypothetical protein
MRLRTRLLQAAAAAAVLITGLVVVPAAANASEGCSYNVDGYTDSTINGISDYWYVNTGVNGGSPSNCRTLIEADYTTDNGVYTYINSTYGGYNDCSSCDGYWYWGGDNGQAGSALEAGWTTPPSIQVDVYDANTGYTLAVCRYGLYSIPEGAGATCNG